MITVSFNCENHNHVLLLTTLYDILTVKDLEESIAAINHVSWLIDEIGGRVNEVEQYDLGISSKAVEVAKIYLRDKDD